MTPDVSVIIPTYNRVADLRRALRSVLRQTHCNWEAVVVDNNSSDGTRLMIEGLGDPRIRFIEINNEGIVGRSRNVGIRAATAEYVAMLDSDDWWRSGKLERCLRALRAGADVAYHSLYLVQAPRQRVHWRRTRTRVLRAPVFDDLLTRGNPLANSSVVMRRSLILQIGGFSEERAKIGYEDFDVWLRAARATERFALVPGTLGYYWSGGENLSTPELMMRNLDDFRVSWLTNDAEWHDRLPGWVHYALGRAHFELGAWQPALEHMRQARAGSLVLDVRARAILTSFAAFVRLHTAAN
jgi:glycosyltransferase involved in cell wall biosynthesis